MPEGRVTITLSKLSDCPFVNKITGFSFESDVI